MKAFLCFAALLALASGFKFPVRSCPKLSVQDPFLMSNFTGSWYKQYALNTPWELGTCIKYDYSTGNNASTLNLHTQLTTIFGGSQETSSFAVYANANSTEGNLKLTVATYLGDVTGDISILSTDYDNYAILYSCSMVTLGWWTEPYQSLWVITRERELDAPTNLLIKAAVAVIAHDGGPKFTDLFTSSQLNCS